MSYVMYVVYVVKGAVWKVHTHSAAASATCSYLLFPESLCLSMNSGRSIAELPGWNNKVIASAQQRAKRRDPLPPLSVVMLGQSAIQPVPGSQTYRKAGSPGVAARSIVRTCYDYGIMALFCCELYLFAGSGSADWLFLFWMFLLLARPYQANEKVVSDPGLSPTHEDTSTKVNLPSRKVLNEIRWEKK